MILVFWCSSAAWDQRAVLKLLEEELEADGQGVVEFYEKAMKRKLRKIGGEMLSRLLEQSGAGVSVGKERAAQLLVDVSDDK